MKKILIISVIAICNSLAIYAQDVINPPKFEYFLPTHTYFSLISHDTGFKFGWNWGQFGEELDEALGINTYHGFPYGTSDVTDNALVIEQPNCPDSIHIMAGHNKDVVMNAHCLHLEPTLTVDSTDNFTPRAGDTTGAVFGWLNRNIGINGSTGTGDFDRFLLNVNSVTTPTLVFSNIWKSDILKWLDYDERFSSFKSMN